MKKKLIVGFCSSVQILSAVTLLDFGTARDLKWRLWNGAFADKAAAARQFSFSPEGLRIEVDQLRTRKATSWLILGVSGDRNPEIPVGARLTLTYRIPAESVVEKPGNLVVIDGDGERFTFAPVSIDHSGERGTATYLIREGGHVGGFAATKPVTGHTGGTNRNDRLDAPLHLHTLSFSLQAHRTVGTVLLEKIDVDESVKPSRTVTRALCSFQESDQAWSFGFKPEIPTFWRTGRPATTGHWSMVALRYRNFPGLKPVPGMQTVTVTTASPLPLAGDVVAQFTNPATGKKKRARAPWRAVTRIVLDLPHDTLYQFNHLEFWPRKGKPMDFAVTAIDGTWLETAAEAIQAHVETGNPLFLVRTAAEKPLLVLRNTAAEPCTITGSWRVADFHGEGPTFMITNTLAAGEVCRVPIPGATRKGVWRVLGTVRAADGSTACHECRFAVLDPVSVTPRWVLGQHFRMGVNYHAGRFAPGDLRRTMDALAAAGVKLVRLGGYHFGSCQPAPGRFDWTQADRIMAEGEAHGISFDAGIYAIPAWAQDPVHREHIKGMRKAAQAPPRPGLMRDYAEAVAARYGTRIDYYELGNEWDLVPPEILPEADAIRLQREAWEGLKKGCPAAKLIPNGWTSDMTFDRPGMNRAGFQERFMIATRGCYDFHPTHMHSVFPRYVESVTRLMAQRRRLGLENIPWYSNETALTTVNGNEAEAARTVWKKILYAWSQGACDYIWYNLKATGWVPSDPEQAYGLLAADFQPRATYAALAGLIATAQGLSFEATLAQGGTRWLFRVGGAKLGFTGRVLVGWDAAAPQHGCPLRVKTDARAAWAVDLFGNRASLPIANETVAWHLGSEPAALMLTAATRAEPVAADLTDIPTLPILSIPAQASVDREPDITLARAKDMHDLYEADPANVRRTWQGPADLSARIWFAKCPEGLRVKIAVSDDHAAAGDDVMLTARFTATSAPVTLSLTHDKRAKTTRTICGDETTYDTLLPYTTFAFAQSDLKDGLLLGIRVLEDDGDGPDGWLQTATEGLPFRLIKFQ